jgi:hypothetical protein
MGKWRLAYEYHQYAMRYDNNGMSTYKVSYSFILIHTHKHAWQRRSHASLIGSCSTGGYVLHIWNVRRYLRPLLIIKIHFLFPQRYLCHVCSCVCLRL